MWMKDVLLPKLPFNGKLQYSRRPRHKRKKNFKDVDKNNLRAFSTNTGDWEETMINQSTQKKVIYKSSKAFVTRRIEHSRLKRILRKQDSISDSYTLHPEYIFNICNRVCLSKTKLTSRMSTHDSKLSKTLYTKVLQQQPTGNSCQFCEKVWRSLVDLRSHIKMHRININGKDSQFICHAYNRACRDIIYQPNSEI